MTTAADVTDLILDAFRVAWGSTTPIAWPNGRFDVDTDVPDREYGFVRVTVQYADGEFAGLGTDVEIRGGFVIVQIFTGEGTGPAIHDAHVESALRWLATWPRNAVTMRGPSAVSVGNDGGGWWQTNVTAEFEYRTTP